MLNGDLDRISYSRTMKCTNAKNKAELFIIVVLLVKYLQNKSVYAHYFFSGT